VSDAAGDAVPGADDLLRRAAALFDADASVPPPLTLRGGNAIDGYDAPPPFDPVEDATTDAYLEGYAFWGLIYLDARSWRHYLPRLLAYAFAHPDDPHMVVEALIRSLRPPDRYPPRLATLDAPQEALVREFLETVATYFPGAPLQEDAMQALAEWWWPDARHRPRDDAPPHTPPTFARVEACGCALELPTTFRGSGDHVPAESRTIHVWRGTLGAAVPTMVAINVSHDAAASWRETLARSEARLGATARHWDLRGVPGTRRIDGLVCDASPAEPETLTMLLAIVGMDIVTLTVRTYPVAEVADDVERIVRSFTPLR
jgi:hypothetical protein